MGEFGLYERKLLDRGVFFFFYGAFGHVDWSSACVQSMALGCLFQSALFEPPHLATESKSSTFCPATPHPFWNLIIWTVVILWFFFPPTPLFYITPYCSEMFGPFSLKFNLCNAEVRITLLLCWKWSFVSSYRYLCMKLKPESRLGFSFWLLFFPFKIFLLSQLVVVLPDKSPIIWNCSSERFHCFLFQLRLSSRPFPFCLTFLICAVFLFCPFFIFISPSPLLCSHVLRCPGQLSSPVLLCYVTYLLMLLKLLFFHIFCLP